VPDGVLQEVLDHALEPGRPAGTSGAVERRPNVHTRVRGDRSADAQRVAHDVLQGHEVVTRLGIDGAGVQLHQLEEVLDQTDQRLDRAAHVGGVPTRRRLVADDPVVDRLDHCPKAGQGGAEIMRDGSDEVVALAPGGGLGCDRPLQPSNHRIEAVSERGHVQPPLEGPDASV
jgi:hypothetical protein